MNDTQKQKTKFRSSKVWKAFRSIKYEEQNGRCYICNQKLGKTANLHHLDLDANNYTDVSDPSHFVFLCNSCHKFIHWKYGAYKRCEFSFEKLNEVWNRMESINL